MISLAQHVARVLIVAALLLCASPQPAYAGDARWFSAAIGSGENIGALRLGAEWQPACECAWLTTLRATPLLLAHVEYWNSTSHGQPQETTWNVGALAGAHWMLWSESRWRPYIEFAVGGIAVTAPRIGNRELGSSLLFDERLATGIALDPAGTYQLAAFAEHRSNAGIRHPNDGLTTYGIELRVAWH